MYQHFKFLLLMCLLFTAPLRADEQPNPRLLKGGGESVRSAAFSHDGRLLASGNRAGEIVLWETSTWTQTKVIKTPDRFAWALSFSPDDTRLVSSSRGGLRLWDIKSGTQLHEWKADDGWLMSNAWSPASGGVPAGSTLATVHMIYKDNNYSSAVKIWDTATGKLVRELPRRQATQSVAYVDANTLSIIAESRDDPKVQTTTAELWNLASGQMQSSVPLIKNTINDRTAKEQEVEMLLSTSEDGKLVAIGQWRGEGNGGSLQRVQVRDTQSGAVLQTLSASKAPMESVTFAPDGTALITSGNDNALRLWDVKSGALRQTFVGDYCGNVERTFVSPDGRLVATTGGGNDGALRIWDMTRPQPASFPRQLFGHQSLARAVAYSPDGKNVASASGRIKYVGEWIQSAGGEIKLWDTKTGEEKRTLIGHSSFINALAFSPDGRLLASGSEDSSILIWSMPAGKILFRLNGHHKDITTLAFGAGGRTLASASYDGTVRLWDVKSGRAKRTLTGHTGWVQTIAVAPDGKTLASGGRDGRTILWDIATGRRRGELPRLDSVAALAFSNTKVTSGSTLARAGTVRSSKSGALTSIVEVWAMPASRRGSIKRLRTLSGIERATSALTFVPGRQTLATSGITTRNGHTIDGEIVFWDVHTGKKLRALQDPCGVERFAFSPGGRAMATASLNRNIKLWNLEGE